jgi:hypothetical protein
VRIRKHTLGWLGIWIFTCAAVSAADFWIEKPFLEWSNGEAEKMTTDSPWAVVVAVALPPNLPVPSDGGGRGGGGGGGQGFGPDPTRIRIAISWRSALPVRQAVLRTQVGRRGTPTTEQLAALEQPEAFYVIGLSGLPPVRPGGRFEAFLKRKNKPDIVAQQAAMQLSRGSGTGTGRGRGPGEGFGGGGGGSLVVVRFPRGDITVEDREVDFFARVDRLEFGRKFKLADMMFGGKLEL